MQGEGVVGQLVEEFVLGFYALVGEEKGGMDGGNGGWRGRYPRLLLFLFQPPDPDAELAELVAQPLDVAGRKAAPGVVDRGQDLQALQLVALFDEGAEIATYHYFHVSFASFPYVNGGIVQS